MLIIEIALGVVLGFVLLCLMTYKEFWQFIGCLVGLFLLWVFYLNRDTKFVEYILYVIVFLVAVSVFLGGLLAIVENTQNIKNWFLNIPSNIKNKILFEKNEYKQANIIIKIFFWIGLITIFSSILLFFVK